MYKMNYSGYNDTVSYRYAVSHTYEVLERVEVRSESNLLLAYLLPKQLILAIPRLFNNEYKVAQVVWPINGFIPFHSSSRVQLIKAYAGKVTESEELFTEYSHHTANAQTSNFTKFPQRTASNSRMCGKEYGQQMLKNKNVVKSSSVGKHTASFQQEEQIHEHCGSNNPKSLQSMKENSESIAVTNWVPLLDPSSSQIMLRDYFFRPSGHPQPHEFHWQRMLLSRHRANNVVSHVSGKLIDKKTLIKSGVLMTNDEITTETERDQVSNSVSMENNDQGLDQNSQKKWENETSQRRDSNNDAALKRVTARLQLANSCLTRKEWRHKKERWTTVSALSYALEQKCRNNDKGGRSVDLEDKTEFHAEIVPKISIAEYLERIAWYFNCSTQCFVLALEYIERSEKCKPPLKVNYNTVHQLIATCVKVSAKYFDDNMFNNAFYAQVVGLPKSVTNAFEVRLLFFLKFDLYIEPEHYTKRYKLMLSNNEGPNAVIISPAGICNVDGKVRQSMVSSHRIS